MGCVAKINSNNINFRGTALVFDSEKAFLNALEKGEISRDNFIILRYQGETIGCPEMLTPTSALSGYFGENPPPIATDGRFSGGSKGILVAHLPDAYRKGNLTSSIKNGSIIELDLNKATLNILDKVDKSLNKKTIELDGYLEKYSKLVQDISTGYLT